MDRARFGVDQENAVDREGNVYFAYASDNRGWMPPHMAPRNHSVAVAKLGGLGRRLEPGLGKRPEKTTDTVPIP